MAEQSAGERRVFKLATWLIQTARNVPAHADSVGLATMMRTIQRRQREAAAVR